MPGESFSGTAIWTGRRLAAGAAIGLALAFLLARGPDWPALAAAAALGLGAALLALPERGRPGRASGQGVLRDARASTDLTIEGLVSALPIPAILVDPRLVVRSHNGRAVELVPGLRRGEPLMLALRTPEVVEAVRQVLAGHAVQEVDFAERLPVSRWFRVQAAPVAVTATGRDTGQPDYVLVSLRDLTEERRLEQFRADFVANASHELRTPLASVVGFIETLQGPARNDPAARERFLSIMLAQARRMSRLIDDLMSLSRVELNEHVRPSGTVDLVPLIGHVREILEPGADGVAITVEAKVPSLRVTGDQDELIRLFENLVQNAIKYGSSGGRIDIRIGRELGAKGRPEAVVSVTDYGPGIAAEHLPRLTERFYRVDVASSRDKGGTGLGLALVKHIVNRHRGRLAIESAPGRGATFTVRLEAAAESPDLAVRRMPPAAE